MDDRRDDEWGDRDTPWSRRSPRDAPSGPPDQAEPTRPPPAATPQQTPPAQGPTQGPSPGQGSPPPWTPAPHQQPRPAVNPAVGPPPVNRWMPAQVHVPDHQGLAITALVLSLCSVLGLVPAAIAMVQSSAVNSRLRHGDVAGAQVASDRVRLWSLVAIAVSLLLYALVWISNLAA